MMYYVELTYNGNSYNYSGSNNLKMDILGCFFASDINCHRINIFEEWILNKAYTSYQCNITFIEKHKNFIYLSDLYSEEMVPTKLQMTTEKFLNLLSDWKEKVCKQKPKKVTIKYSNDQFSIEIKN